MNLASQFAMKQKVRDSLTGFEGSVTSISFHLSGLVQYCVVASKDGKIVEEWLSEDRLQTA